MVAGSARFNQIETHPFFQRADYQQLMTERGVQIESWGPFAEGRNNLFTDPTLSGIGAPHGKSAAQVVLRWLIQRSVVVIPKSVRADRIRENIDVFGLTLSHVRWMGWGSVRAAAPDGGPWGRG